MLTRADVSQGKVVLSKNLVTDQTYNNMTFKLNAAGRAFSVTNGVGTSTATSTIAVIHAGGFNDQKITAVMKYVSPTTAGSEDFGVLLRAQSFEDTASSTYYYARCTAGNARITKVVGGTFTTLSSAAFALAADTDVTITFQVVGNSLSASFVATGGTPTTVNLAAVDSSITMGGLVGFRSLTSTMYCKSFVVEQL